MLTRFDTMHERDRHHQTDGQTDTACTTAGRAMQASRGNKTGQGLMAASRRAD